MIGSKPAIVTLGKYQIRGTLGRGAMGTVYDGWDPVIGRRVAIKTVRMADHDDAEAQEGLDRFKNEAQAAGRLSHPNIVAVYDYGEADETAFIVMEFIEGHSLKERLDTREPVPLAETVRIMQQVLAALQFSHDKGVIHRDVKPGNVMLTIDGQVKLADFGIARIESSAMTQVGTMIGTPAYMSPEQLLAEAVDARSDIYSSGVLLYQLLTGERPFECGLPAIMHKALNTTPKRPSEVSVTAAPSMDPVVAQAMARRPDDRYPNAAAFALALRDAFAAPQSGLASSGLPSLGPDDEATMVIRPSGKPPVSQPPPSSPQSSPAPPGRRAANPALLGGAAAIVFALIGGGAWFALRPSAPQPSQTVVAPVPNPAPVNPTPVEPSPQPPPPAGEATPPSPIPPAETTPPSPRPPAEATAPSPPEAQAPPANPLPAPVVLVPPNPAAIRDALRSVPDSARCTLPQFTVSEDGHVSISGIVGSGTPDAALRDAVQAATSGAPLTWTIRTIDGPYCEVFDTVRPIAGAGSPFLGLDLRDGATRLKAHEFILPIVNLPDFPMYLQVDYFSHDGSVAHLFPLPGAANPVLNPNATKRLGLDPHGKPNLEVGPPFGTDVIVAIASSVPLFTGRVRDDETRQTYLPVLKAAIDAAQRRNARLTGRVMVVETVEH
jgi:serine/threonine protein kinase